MNSNADPKPYEIPAYFEERERMDRVHRVLMIIGVHDPENGREVVVKSEGPVFYLLMRVDLSDDPLLLENDARVFNPDSVEEVIEFPIGWDTVQACEDMLEVLADASREGSQ